METAVITGKDVRWLRDEFRLTQTAFASIVGVAISSVARWEAAGDGAVRLDPRAKKLLEELLEIARQRGPEENHRLGATIRAAMVAKSPLFVLFLLLEWVFEGRS